MAVKNFNDSEKQKLIQIISQGSQVLGEVDDLKTGLRDTVKSLAEELDKTNIEIVDFMLMSWARVEDELVASNVELDTFVKIKEKWGQILTELLDEQDRIIN